MFSSHYSSLQCHVILQKSFYVKKKSLISTQKNEQYYSRSHFIQQLNKQNASIKCVLVTNNAVFLSLSAMKSF